LEHCFTASMTAHSIFETRCTCNKTCCDKAIFASSNWVCSGADCRCKAPSSTRQLTFPVSDRTQPASRVHGRSAGEFCRVTPRRCPATVDTASRRSSTCHPGHVDQLATEDCVLCSGHRGQGMSLAPPVTADVPPVPARTITTYQRCLRYYSYAILMLLCYSYEMGDCVRVQFLVPDTYFGM